VIESEELIVRVAVTEDEMPRRLSLHLSKRLPGRFTVPRTRRRPWFVFVIDFDALNVVSVI
jgi:hypothetical protein